MKKIGRIITLSMLLAAPFVSSAESYKDNFDSNSLGWTESSVESYSGSAVIDQGVMTVKSFGLSAAASALAGVKVGALNTFFETHCYAPIDVKKPFKIRTHVNIAKLAVDREAGLIFNYRDGGTFYVFEFTLDMVKFKRFENNVCVGTIMQGVKWQDTKKLDQEWVLESDGDKLTFSVDGLEMLNVRYMPLNYSGVGFYTWGKQILKVDDIEFIQ